ncbi:MAG TPA: tRNA pseudouridine(38-40) synthase TruA [Pyrinomonadaceae bacterium]|nr:tRNA pseudouridine(38-40) synthase TruA [Pyrinomonadaceae bacterium]
MQAFKLLIEYEGTRYRGWQKQPNARTVQGELLKAAGTVFQGKVEIGGSGRTDAGVHALAQVAHLKVVSTGKPFPPKIVQKQLNELLPSDINILQAQNEHPQFHARHDAVARYYLYQICTRRTAFGKPYVWWVRDRLDVALMSEACRILIGRGNFRSFCEEEALQKSTIVQVDAAELAASGSLILFRIGASHFLWKMVRRIVGVLVEIGRGNITIPRFQKLLTEYSNEPAALTAPPSGLFLEHVLYKNDAPPKELKPFFPIS